MMTNKNTGKDIRQNSPKEHQGGQPEPCASRNASRREAALE